MADRRDDVPPAHVAEFVRPPEDDRLTRARDGLRQLRDARIQIKDVEEVLRGLGAQESELKYKTLPDLFLEAGVDTLGLPPEGNHPGWDAKLKDYYKANIAANWSAERRAAAFALLTELGLGDIVKTEITVRLDKGDAEGLLKIREALAILGFSYEVGLSVPWTTLTAAIKELRQGGQQLTDTQLETLGAVVGKIVDMKERR